MELIQNKDRELVDELVDDFLEYAVSVVEDRAIPAFEDGLKPSQRRVLYAMHQLGLNSNGKTRTSAFAVGAAVGQFHPKGDESVYQTLVRMARKYVSNYPLVYGQGNFGSQDGDEAASMRYTQSKLNKAAEFLIHKMDNRIQLFQDNYDLTLKEPVYFRSYFPNVFLNPSSGIAVGMSTNTVPFNMAEVLECLRIHLLDKKEYEYDWVSDTLLGPDFATGGSILIDPKEKQEIYKEGKGSFRITGNYEVVKKGKEVNIVFNSIPYGVKKSDILVELSDIFESLEGVLDIEDKSSGEEVALSFKIDPRYANQIDTICQILYKKTSLSKLYHVNNLFIHNFRPIQMSIIDMFREYTSAIRSLYSEELKWELSDLGDKLEIIMGELRAIDLGQELIRVFKESTIAQARTYLENLGFTELQVKRVLDLKLSRFNINNREALEKEVSEINKRIQRIIKIQETPQLFNKQLYEQVLGTYIESPRKTQVREYSNASKINISSTQMDMDFYVIVGEKSGSMVRLAESSIKTQTRGGKGNRLSTTLDHVLPTSTIQQLIIFTNKNRIFSIKTYELPVLERNQVPHNVSKLFPSFEPGERIVTMCSFSEGDLTPDSKIILFSRMGRVNICDLNTFTSFTSRNPRMGGPENIVSALIIHTSYENLEVILISEQGRAIRTQIGSDFRIGNRRSPGNTRINLETGDYAKTMTFVNPGDQLMIVRSDGYARTINPQRIRSVSNRAAGINLFPIKERGNEIITSSFVNNKYQDLVIFTQKGYMLRVPSEGVKISSSLKSIGSRLLTLSEKDSVLGAYLID